jgi:hypothetical protein
MQNPVSKNMGRSTRIFLKWQQLSVNGKCILRTEIVLLQKCKWLSENLNLNTRLDVTKNTKCLILKGII